ALNQADANASTLSVDFHGGPGSSMGNENNSAAEGGQQSGDSPSFVRSTGQTLAADILSAANAGTPIKVVSSSATDSKSSIGSTVWAAGAQWLSPSQSFAAQAAKTLQGTQKTAGLGINWDLADFSGRLNSVFGPEVVKAI